MDKDHVLKAVSTNYKCAIIHDSGTANSLKVYNFGQTSTTSATIFNTVTASLYTGITLTDEATTFAVSDDCRGIRIK